MNNSYFFIGIIMIFFLQSCDSTSQGSTGKVQKEQVYKEQIRDVKVIESSTPANFLKVEGTYRKNLVGKTIIEGKINNLATVVTYKDINIKVGFYSRPQWSVEVLRPFCRPETEINDFGPDRFD